MIKGDKGEQLAMFDTKDYERESPWALAPEHWQKDPNVAFHSSHEDALPARNKPDASPDFNGYRPDPDDSDYVRDKYGDRFHKDDFGFDITEQIDQSSWGNANGLHLGTYKAAHDRDKQRPYMHTARVPPETHDSELWNDDDANYARPATEKVMAGRSIPYRNDSEDAGSTSWRTLPETLKTWGEDVMASPNAHPAMKAAAEAGYNVGQDLRAERRAKHADMEHEQRALWDYEVTRGGFGRTPEVIDYVNGDYNTAVGRKNDAYLADTSKWTNTAHEGPVPEAPDQNHYNVTSAGATARDIHWQQERRDRTVNGTLQPKQMELGMIKTGLRR